MKIKNVLVIILLCLIYTSCHPYYNDDNKYLVVSVELGYRGLYITEIRTDLSDGSYDFLYLYGKTKYNVGDKIEFKKIDYEN